MNFRALFATLADGQLTATAVKALPRDRLDERSPSKLGEKQDTLLIRAVRLGRLPSTKALLEAGAGVDALAARVSLDVAGGASVGSALSAPSR